MTSTQMQTTRFQVPVTKEEKERRAERKARFLGGRDDGYDDDAPKMKKKKKQQHLKISAADALDQPLTSARGGTSSTSRSSSESDVVNSQPKNEQEFVGTNENLEKPYFRLTTYPNACDVRPLHICIQALAHIKHKYVTEEDFEWANEQFKSLRQDLTVQRIQHTLVLEVYETHARILLEHGDLNEFNQCQTMIHTLCGEGTAHYSNNNEQTVLLQQSKEAVDEFAGYAVLYALVRDSPLELNLALQRPQHLAKTPPHSQQNKKMKRRCPSSSKQPQQQETTNRCCYQHALSVVQAVVEDDFTTFFRLYRSAPHMSAYLMDFLVKRVRQAAFRRVIHAYFPVLGMEQLREWLCFDDLEQTRRFCHQQGAVFVAGDMAGIPLFWVDCKASCKKNLMVKTSKCAIEEMK